MYLRNFFSYIRGYPVSRQVAELITDDTAHIQVKSVTPTDDNVLIVVKSFCWDNKVS